MRKHIQTTFNEYDARGLLIATQTVDEFVDTELGEVPTEQWPENVVPFAKPEGHNV